jgi:hypothetical protein
MTVPYGLKLFYLLASILLIKILLENMNNSVVFFKYLKIY